LGVCDSAEAAAVLAALEDFALASVLLAADAALRLVCLVFRPIPLTSSCLLVRGTRR
jgi:hypothetical protein